MALHLKLAGHTGTSMLDIPNTGKDHTDIIKVFAHYTDDADSTPTRFTVKQ